MNLTNKKVKMELVGLDTNAYAIMAAFIRAARKQGWTHEESKAVIDEATSSDYTHLLATILKNVVDPDDDDEDDWGDEEE
jgi:hypothetical protein